MPAWGALAGGAFAALIGVLVIFVGAGALGTTETDVPPWVLVCFGVMLVLGGAAFVNGFVLSAGVAASGEFLPGTAFLVRVVQYVLGLGIATMLALVFSWIALGPGPRVFAGTGLLAPMGLSEPAGRAVFGVAALAMWVFEGALAVVGFRRLRRG